MNAQMKPPVSKADAERRARVDLAACHRLAVMYGYHEGIDNHLTLLVPGYEDRFFLAPFGLHWSEIKASDFLIVDLYGNVLSGRGPVEDTAFFIHAPIHGSARHIQCVLHTHMPYATALSLLENPTLEMCSQNAIGFYGEISYDCDYNGFALDRAEGERMCAALGHKSVLVLRNHGIITTGRSVAEAFNSLYFFERAAQTQILAMSTGRPLRIVPQPVVDHMCEQFKASADVGGASRIDLHFEAMKRVLDRREPDYAS